jgi:RloB-like protein
VSSRSRGGHQRPSQATRVQLIVFAEGKKTESIYLTHWNRLYRENAIVNIAAHEHTAPFELVKSAANQRRLDLREAKRGRGAAFDQYWCMFDIDEHPKISDALVMAGDNSINIALSSPCLELWFLLHFDDQTAYLHRHEAQKRSKEILSCDKVLTPAALDSLIANYETAKSRAQSLEAKHIADESSRPWNPYSDVWTLMDVIKTGVA